MTLTYLATPVGLLWFSAPSSLNRKFANNGTREQEPEKLKIRHMGGKLPTPTSIGNEFTSKTMGMARRKESRDGNMVQR